MQNEKQRHLVEDNESQFFSQNVFDEQTKGTPSGKMLAQAWKFWLRMNNFTGKKSVKHKAKGPTKRFSYDLGGPKPLEKKIRKFLSHPISRGGAKRAKKKEPASPFFALGQTSGGSSLCLDLLERKKRGLTAKFTQMRTSRSKPDKTHKRKYKKVSSRIFDLSKS